MPTRSVMSGTRATLPPIERPSVMACPAPVHRPADSTNQVPRPSLAAIIMLGWFICVLSLLVRLARTQLRLHAHLQHLSALDETRLGIDLRELCRLASIRQTVRIVECDGIGAPSVWGIARPMIVLPRGIAMALTAQQLRWALLHELAHIRRFDLVVVGLQRCAAILHFINPVVWATNRIIHRLREYACDDLAVSIGQTTGVESGEAFLRILRRADRDRRTLEGALGIFGLDSRASCFLRVRRLLDTERPIRSAPGAWSLWALGFLAAVLLPHLRGGRDVALAGPQPPSKDATAPNRAKPAGEETLELRVVGPEGNPIPGARVVVVEDQRSAIRTTDAEGAARLVPFAITCQLHVADHRGRLWSLFGGLVVPESRSAGALAIHRRAGGRLVGGGRSY